MVARPAQCQAGQGTRFNARFDQPLDRHLISATALETRDELNATGGHFGREHIAQMALQSLHEVIAAGVIDPAHPAQMRQEMPVGNELGQPWMWLAAISPMCRCTISRVPTMAGGTTR